MRGDGKAIAIALETRESETGRVVQMRFEIPFTEEDGSRAINIPVTPLMMANASFEGVRVALSYWQFHLWPVLRTFLRPTEREETFMSLLNRAVACLASLRRLNESVHVQCVCAATRSLFEIGVDLALLYTDQTDVSIERMKAFRRAELYRVAKKQVDYYAVNVRPDYFNIEQQRLLVADQAERDEIERLIELYWGRNRAGDLNRPKHWSAFGDARGRAHAVSPVWEERYVRQYHTLSWYIHPGLVGIVELPREHFDAFNSTAYHLATEIILDCYDVVGSELRLAHAVAEWPHHLFFLRNTIGFALIDEQLRTLGEPGRFTYLEPGEQEMYA